MSLPLGSVANAMPIRKHQQVRLGYRLKVTQTGKPGGKPANYFQKKNDRR